MLNRSLLTCLTLGAVALGGMSSASADVVSFRDGVNGYAGTADTYVAASAPSTNFGTNFALQISGSGGTGANAGIQQSLVRFDDIFGSGPNQITPGSTINNATFSVVKSGGFGNVQLYQLTTDFSENTSTFNSLGNGIQLTTETTGTLLGSNDFGGNAGPRIYDVTATLAAYASGAAANQGFLLRMSDSNPGATAVGLSSDATTVTDRPLLTVDFTPAEVPEPASLALLGLGSVALLGRRRRG